MTEDDIKRYLAHWDEKRAGIADKEGNYDLSADALKYAAIMGAGGVGGAGGNASWTGTFTGGAGGAGGIYKEPTPHELAAARLAKEQATRAFEQAAREKEKQEALKKAERERFRNKNNWGSW